MYVFFMQNGQIQRISAETARKNQTKQDIYLQK